MSNIMTPSKTTTAGQIDKAVANYRALLEKYSKEFDAETVQIVLGQPALANEQLAVFRRRVELNSNQLVRVVAVDRTRTPDAALAATGRKQYVDDGVVASMSHGEGEEVKVVFFKISCWISDADLEKEYESRGLKPADPYSLAAVNEADPAFADEHPNGTHWRNARGQWCYATFGRWGAARSVRVRRNGHGWVGSWWFAGLAS